MQILILLCVIASILLVTQALEIPGIRSLPSQWLLSPEPIDQTAQVALKIALVPKDAPELERRLIEIATPGSKVFRQYLSKDEITAIVGRSDADIARVTSWLAAQGIDAEVQVHPHRDWIMTTASIASIQKAFQCELGLYTNARKGINKVAAKGSYHIPDELVDVIQLVSGMTSLPAGRWGYSKVDPETSLGAAAAVTPTVIYDTYQTDSSGSHGSKKGSQTVIEFGAVANFNDADTQTFFTKFAPALVGETTGMVWGTNNGAARPSVEANLDVQYIMGTGVFVNTTGYKITTNSNDTLGIEDEFLDYTTLVNSQNEPPLVHSISYGEYGGSYDNVTDQKFSYELQKMGISGISVLLASGDNGVGCDAAGTTQEFDYPSSPYITMVGATYLDTITRKEVGATLSSGGFSLDFYQPAWQKAAVDSYFAQNVTLPKEYYYRYGRAYPDMAAFGQNVQVVASGVTEAVSGTSCSAPIFGGIVALINHALITAGHAPLGFLQPWMYAYPDAFTDVTSGNNAYQKCQGFNAAPGWDPVT